MTLGIIFNDFLPAAAEKVTSRWREVLLKNFDARNDRPLHLSHFLPVTFFNGYVDTSNGDEYLEEDMSVTRLKCLALVAATPIVQAVSLVLNGANKVVKVVSFAHFRYPSQSERAFEARLGAFGRDCLVIASSPILYVGLELATLYGLILPKNGRKLYATFERCLFGDGLLAPCFQPDPSGHLGGASLETLNAW